MVDSQQQQSHPNPWPSQGYSVAPITVVCGPREDGQSRVVVIKHSREIGQVRDVIDTDKIFPRRKLIEACFEAGYFQPFKGPEADWLDREILRKADEIDAGGEDTDELDACPVAEFMRRDFHQDFLVSGIWPAAQPGVASAKSKSLKTTAAVDLCVSAASGCNFLGDPRWSVPNPVPVGIISAESGGATLQESLRRIAFSKGLRIEEVENLHVGTTIPHLATSKGRDKVERFIDKHQLQALALDPTYKAFAGVETNSESKMAELLFPLSEIIDRTGCSILMVNHNRKTPAVPGRFYDEPTFDEIQGTGFQQWARHFLLLNKRREWDPDTGRHWLWFKSEGSAGFGSRSYLDVREGRCTDPGGRVWDVTVSDPTEGKQQEQEAHQAERDAKQLHEDRRAVCGVLAKHPAGLTKTKTMDLSGVSRRRFEGVIEAMLDEGDITPTEVHVANQKTPRPGFKLNTEDQDQEAA